MQLFFNPTIEKDHTLEKEEHTHATKVLRKQVGDLLWIMNGKGDLFECEITQIGSKKTHVSIKTKQSFSKKNNLHIAIAPTKNNNRMEFFLEKGTEIGIAEITPIICERSERKILKVDRMEKILVSAGKQSKCFNLPIINPMISLKELLKNTSSDKKYIAHCEENGSKKNLLDYAPSRTESILILIGPEGDFTSKEIELAKEQGFHELSLGETRLRTETAAIVACTHYTLTL